VMVLDAETPTITVNGVRSQAVDEYDLSHGVHLFPDVIIDATTKAEHNERNSDNVCRHHRIIIKLIINNNSNDLIIMLLMSMIYHTVFFS